MAAKGLSIQSIGDLATGAAAVIINDALKEAAADTDDRGEDGKPRSVIIEVIMVRREDGLIETATTAKAKLPARRTPSTTCKPVRRGKHEVELMFETWSPENPNQPAFEEMDKE